MFIALSLKKIQKIMYSNKVLMVTWKGLLMREFWYCSGRLLRFILVQCFHIDVVS